MATILLRRDNLRPRKMYGLVLSRTQTRRILQSWGRVLFWKARPPSGDIEQNPQKLLPYTRKLSTFCKTSGLKQASLEWLTSAVVQHLVNMTQRATIITQGSQTLTTERIRTHSVLDWCLSLQATMLQCGAENNHWDEVNEWIMLLEWTWNSAFVERN